jgi:hypothetical protein
MPAKRTASHRPRSHELPPADEKRGYDGLFQSIKPLVESLQALNQQAVTEYAPIVEDILRSRSRDTQHIEHTLDGLLDFCGYEPALVLFKKLCRHYWEIDPVATARQINAYREFWDSDESEDGKPAPQAPGGDGA